MSRFSLAGDKLLSGFQWFFFIFCNTVVVPPTLRSAFQLPPAALLTLTQYAFVATGLACLLQAVMGHRRAIMEGPTGLWWGTILTVTVAESAQGTPINSIASSLMTGIFLAALLTMAIGLSGLGHRLARLFSPAVMVVFMLLLGAQLTTIFFKGMLGLPFGVASGTVAIQAGPFALALLTMGLVLAALIVLPVRYARYSLLIGVLFGWGAWALFLPSPDLPDAPVDWHRFPLGHGGEIHFGIVLTAVLAGLVNISNTYGAIRGTERFYPDEPAEEKTWRRSFMVSGFMTLVTVPFGVVPFSPFVSSVGLLTQTGDSSRQIFVFGSFGCVMVGINPYLTELFCRLPLPVISAVMLVSYLPLLFSSLLFSQQMTLTSRNIYRLALPLFTGLFLMGLSPVYLQDLPISLRPLLSNGLLVGILLAVAMDNFIPWKRIA